jgi:hypothetical protein
MGVLNGRLTLTFLLFSFGTIHTQTEIGACPKDAKASIAVSNNIYLGNQDKCCSWRRS